MVYISNRFQDDTSFIGRFQRNLERIKAANDLSLDDRNIVYGVKCKKSIYKSSMRNATQKAKN